MGLRDLLRRGDRPGTVRSARSDDVYHLEEWASSPPRRGGLRRAGDLDDQHHAGAGGRGRRVDAAPGRLAEGAPSPSASKTGIPVYDVAATGYPPRMREWTAKRKAAGETGPPPAR